MKAMFIVHEHMSKRQQENAYLLCLAMLNFEHEVHLVFTELSWQKIHTDNTKKKQWLALKLYGTRGMYQIEGSLDSLSGNADQILTSLSISAFDELKNAMDFLS